MIPNTGLGRHMKFEIDENMMKHAQPIETGEMTIPNCILN
jgi:hypothetical protein